MADDGKILGKSYFRDDEVNEGFYSKKREGVADVDPKVSPPLVTVMLGDGTLHPHPWKASAEGGYRQTEEALRFPQH
jgi:hypothetical protein